MDCKLCQLYSHAYLDGELDVSHNLEVEEHLADCKTCSLALANHQKLRDATKGASLAFKAPSSLRNKILTSLPKEQARSSVLFRWKLLLRGVTATFALFFVFFALYKLPTTSNNSLLEQEIVSSHIRSLMADHLTDVYSSDQHTVKPWFTGRLNYSPPVVDLASQRFPLFGGRIDYIQNQPVASLIYKRQKHFINLFVWPSENDASNGLKVLNLQGYHLVHWNKTGMTYWAISDLNETELHQFAMLVSITK